MSQVPQFPLAKPEVRAGTRLGRYEMLLPIAQGGMARVWAAKQHGQRGFAKVVAIKTILPALASDPTFEAMFLDEARLASGIHHPNVCEIFDLGEEAGALYLAMEWVNGESLSRIFKPAVPKGEKPKPQRLNARVAARIVAEAAKGLHAAHELRDDHGNLQHLVHRDVSPQNVLISLEGMVKVTDFGVAKALSQTHEATMAGQVKGKVAYMSPEQARSTQVDRRSDVFALGIVLYEITTGQRPFTGANELDVLQALGVGRFDPPSAVVPGYPPELAAVVMRAMAIDPSQRYPTADAMRVALEEWLARSGPLVTEAQVAELVRERVGTQVEERANKVRERMRANTGVQAVPELPPPVPPSEASGSHGSVPSQVSQTGQVGETSAPSQVSHASVPSQVSHVTHASAPSQLSQIGPVVQTAPPPNRSSAPARSSATRTALLGVAIGVGMFGVLGGGGLWLLRKRATARPAAAAPAEAPAQVAPPVSAPVVESQPEIRLQMVEPKSGIKFLLDGVVLPVGTQTVARPKPGAERTLTAQADGYQQDVLRIDNETPEVLDVLLKKLDAREQSDKPRAEPEKPAADKPAAEKATTDKPPPTKPEPPAEKPVKKKPPKPDIPENPF